MAIDPVIYFDGMASRRRAAALAFADMLEIDAGDGAATRWASRCLPPPARPPATLRVSCLTAPPLARLEIRDAAVAAELTSHCLGIDENYPSRRGVATIVGWSVAATVSIIGVIFFGVPLAADRLAPLVPESFERRLGDVAERQVKILFGDKVCGNPAGQQAFAKLVNALREPAGLDPSVQSAVLATPIPNAFALPGRQGFLFDGLLAKAQNPDEIAGVLAHELGHLKHRDNMRGLIYNGGTSFLIGLLFGDITGSRPPIFPSP